jgi:hypothetical protein
MERAYGTSPNIVLGIIEARNWPGSYIQSVIADHAFRVIFERIRAMPWIPMLLLEGND